MNNEKKIVLYERIQKEIKKYIYIYKANEKLLTISLLLSVLFKLKTFPSRFSFLLFSLTKIGENH